MITVLKRIEAIFTDIFDTAGGMLLLLMQCLIEVKFVLSSARGVLRQMLEVGWNTLPLASMIGMFTGMITSLQTGVELKNLGLQQQIGAIVGLSLVREMGPVFTAFIVAARVGASWAAEIGAMSVSDLLDFLPCPALSPP